MQSPIRPPGPGSFTSQPPSSSSPLMTGMQQLGPSSSMGPPPPANQTGGSTSSPMPGTIPTSRPPSQVYMLSSLREDILPVDISEIFCMSYFGNSLPIRIIYQQLPTITNYLPGIIYQEDVLRFFFVYLNGLQ